jgi:hypothetical protein
MTFRLRAAPISFWCSLVFWLGKGMIKIITMAARDMAEAW